MCPIVQRSHTLAIACALRSGLPPVSITHTDVTVTAADTAVAEDSHFWEQVDKRKVRSVDLLRDQL